MSESGAPPGAPPFLRHPDWEPIALAAILIGSAWLRIAHNDAGIPHAVGVDEPEIMERVVRMMKTADFNPHFFDWPSLTTYVQLAGACLTFLAAAMRGRWNSLDAVTAANFYEPARTITAAFGVAMVFVTWRIGLRFGRWTAMVAALLVAVLPNLVRESHYVLADIPAAFFTTLTLLLSMRALERQTTGAFAWAGLAAGLAASCKYNGAAAIVMPLIAAAASGSIATAAARGAVAAVAASGGFLAGTPYAVLDMPKFLNDYARLAAVFARPRGGEPGWSLYLKYLRGSLDVAGMVMAAVGLAIAIKGVLTDRHRARWLLLVVFPVIYFTVMARSYQIYGRYTLPLLPVLSLWAAIGLAGLAKALRRLTPERFGVPLAVGLVAGVVIQPALTSVAFVQSLTLVGTPDLAYRWMNANVPRGTKIAIETRSFVPPQDRYPSASLGSVLDRSYEEYVADKVDYVVAVSDLSEVLAGSPERYGDRYGAYRTLIERLDLVASFEPGPERPGPPFRIYRIRK